MAWETSKRKATLPPNWRQIRKDVLRRDRGICYLCGKPGADQVDHMDQSRNWDHSDENLAAVHWRPCHARKSSQEGRAAQLRHSRKRPEEPHPGLIQPGGR